MRLVALAGNPNVGKSTLFNALTGLNQHTGNWPGKTVELAQGSYEYKGESYRLADLPGTYSLVSRSQEEAVAEQFLREGGADCTVVICDATCLERTLCLALQILELTPRVVLCVNLMDEAARAGLTIDARLLERSLRVPVVTTSAGTGEGVAELQEAVREVCDGFYPLCAEGGGRIRGATEAESDAIARGFVRRAETLARAAQGAPQKTEHTLTQRLDSVLLHPFFGYLVLLVLLLGVFWLTIAGANYPSEGLQWCFDRLGLLLRCGAEMLRLPDTVQGALLDGVYATTARVVSVMLPPMAIFFPIFTILEDFGYLPRVAFLMDHGFYRAGACGKQALTMCMGFGCNAAGVSGCRIIDSEREKRIGMLTNALVPCNGRFPTLLTLSALFFGGTACSAALVLTGCVLLGAAMTMAASFVLGKTILRGAPSHFTLELPPFRMPNVGRVLVRSVMDRSLFVLGRAAAVAAPAGLLLWLLGNVQIGGETILTFVARALEPVGAWLGIDGAILLAFALSFPANELLLPVWVMIVSSGATLAQAQTADVGGLLLSSGWTMKTALCVMVFTLFHFPCSTTVLTIRKETGSTRWALLGMLLPAAIGVLFCRLLNLLL